MRVVDARGYHEPRDAISHLWTSTLRQRGLEPVLVPNLLEDPAAFVERAAVDAILFTNGEDVHPSRYGGDVSLDLNCSTERDRTEFALLDWATDRDMPVVAACRGLQLVNVYCGGSVVPDIAETVPGGLNHVAKTHQVRISDPTTQSHLGARRADVNSYHRHGVTDATLGRGLVSFAESSDGVVEGVYASDKPVLAIQWHPERPGPDNFCQRDLVFHFLEHGRWW